LSSKIRDLFIYQGEKIRIAGDGKDGILPYLDEIITNSVSKLVERIPKDKYGQLKRITLQREDLPWEYIGRAERNYKPKYFLSSKIRDLFTLQGQLIRIAGDAKDGTMAFLDKKIEEGARELIDRFPKDKNGRIRQSTDMSFLNNLRSAMEIKTLDVGSEMDEQDDEEDEEVNNHINKQDSSRISRLAKMVQVSRKLKISQVALILEMSEADLYPRLVDWAAEYGFILDEDIVDFTGGRKDDFIAALEKDFATWGNEGKI